MEFRCGPECPLASDKLGGYACEGRGWNTGSKCAEPIENFEIELQQLDKGMERDARYREHLVAFIAARKEAEAK